VYPGGYLSIQGGPWSVYKTGIVAQDGQRWMGIVFPECEFPLLDRPCALVCHEKKGNVTVFGVNQTNNIRQAANAY
jgi:hypothetical protein